MTDRLIDRIIEIITAIRNNHYFKKLCVPFSIIIVTIIIYSHFSSVSYSYTELGMPPQMGLRGTILFILIFFLAYKFESKVIEFRSFGCMIFIIPFVFFAMYTSVYSIYVESVFHNLMRKQNVVTGVVYDKESRMGRGYNHKLIIVGYEYNGAYKSQQSVSKKIYKNINVGDTLILLVSREHPRVMEILLFDPTKEQKDRYVIPRKFKSYGYGKIEEEEE